MSKSKLAKGKSAPAAALPTLPPVTLRAPEDLVALWCSGCGEIIGSGHVEEATLFERVICPHCPRPTLSTPAPIVERHFYRHSGRLARANEIEGSPEANAKRYGDAVEGRLVFAAVCLLDEPGGTGRHLVVWNGRQRGWALPGGKLEDGESVEAGAARELREETGLIAGEMRRVYDAGAVRAADPGEATYVHVLRVATWRGELRPESADAPVMWMTRRDFLAATAFPVFYGRAFQAIPPARQEATS